MIGPLTGQAAVVTGSSRGLGRAFAVALARNGSRLVVNGTDAAAAQDTADLIVANGGSAIVCVGSVADHAFCQELVDACIDAHGTIDVLVNNAGFTRDRSSTRMTPEEFDEVIAVHLRGTWSCSTAAARAMRGGGGSLINITSGAGLFGMFGQANYSAAKAASSASTESWI
ncbi:SDR family NAD(P)-dependent oxidoreductase [Nocardioides marmoriginsengisoli]|uniref:SDR family NAD(P)-dependent oxidoreductase n=1 Tax=Nocardioides marmoriginsengisoli TaxID=661483 RepID=A0A3N0CH25_9ACTN|nr:SDR family NAD(P)-dependent oxidoreductase [Nocardioides marmoriginsengisoli]RNL62754.1 SDR family NAD(P)-dependent oxidoreductase [Nocardioides marmoriginsengisoli]